MDRKTELDAELFGDLEVVVRWVGGGEWYGLDLRGAEVFAQGYHSYFTELSGCNRKLNHHLKVLLGEQSFI